MCHLLPFGSSSLKDFAILFWLPRPTANSITMIGSPKIKRKNRYRSTNAPPPYTPVIYGNLHTFPRPIAQPADININPSLDENFSLVSTYLISFYFIFLIYSIPLLKYQVIYRTLQLQHGSFQLFLNLLLPF